MEQLIKQATITKIEGAPSKLPGYEGNWIYTVYFDNGFKCYAGEQYRNWKRWKNICKNTLLVTLKGLRIKNKAKMIYNADSKISIVHNNPHVMLRHFDSLFDSTTQAEPENLHLDECTTKEAEELIKSIKRDELCKHMTLDLIDDELEQRTLLVVSDDKLKAIIPIAD
jgi:hypothetical protein|tara:strand:- start:144 stop:647 length:504 start_codon:yes stop_codon:yes gene_type:complete